MSELKPFDRSTYIRKYQARWKAQRRADWMAANGPCVQCGSGEALELDYVDGATKRRPSDHCLCSLTEEKRLAELAKCQVLCKSCRTKKTSEEKRVRQTKPLVHGTKHGYLTHGCRCESCRKALSDYRKTYRRPNSA